MWTQLELFNSPGVRDDINAEHALNFYLAYFLQNKKKHYGK